MGRGRQKAKNTKVARELKYFSPATDFTSLEAELATKADGDQYEDKWADLYEDDEEGSGDVAATDEERSVDQDER